mgnify:CR=1 FL=1
MNSLSIVFIQQDAIDVNINDIKGGIEVIFKGTIEDKNPAPYLTPLFNDIHTKVVESYTKLVELDVRDLTFLNSSGIRCFIQWVAQIPKTPKDKRYHLKIKISKHILWQENSFNLFKSIEPHHISIDKS